MRKAKQEIPVPTMRSAQKTRSPSLRTTSIPHIKSREAGTSKAVVFDASSATLLCETENTTRCNREHTLSDTPAQTCPFYRCMSVRSDDERKEVALFFSDLQNQVKYSAIKIPVKLSARNQNQGKYSASEKSCRVLQRSANLG